MKKKIVPILLTAVVTGAMFPAQMVTAFASSAVDQAVRWSINTANDNTHGYSQSNRWGPDYDCSSFVLSAYKAAGIDTGNASSTSDMRSVLTKKGFTWIPAGNLQMSGYSRLKKGDILLQIGSHAELYIGNGKRCGAHSNYDGVRGDSSGREINIQPYSNKGWNGVLRYTGTASSSSGTTVQADSSKAGYYQVETKGASLNMRAGAGSDYSVVGKVSNGTQIYVKETSSGWGHVSYNGSDGWLSMSYCQALSEGKMTEADTKTAGTVTENDIKADAVTIKVPRVSGVKKTAATASSISLKWKNIPDATYRVYRSRTKKGGYKKVAEIRNSSYVSSGLTSSTKYYFKIKAIQRADGKNYKGKASKVKGYSTLALNSVS